MRPLDPALGLARISANDIDVQRVQRAPKLGHAVAAKRARIIDAEHPVLVAVERDRFAPGFEVGASRVETGEPSTRLGSTPDRVPEIYSPNCGSWINPGDKYKVPEVSGAVIGCGASDQAGERRQRLPCNAITAVCGTT